MFMHQHMEPMLLLSLLNTKLRNTNADLTSICTQYQLDEDWLRDKFSDLGWTYHHACHQFKPVPPVTDCSAICTNP
ncbi:DUF4250 family protein [Thalassotalea mangrovi]|uniref:DUF4250 domain-containing protein n=1 Tax=Thalassotalea mangrovi TaxID=2572245 RepID=A0A4U1BBE9_9GAMM|nr:DUF4250 domain-containing protein [Thalassotalea mangrovi]